MAAARDIVPAPFGGVPPGLVALARSRVPFRAHVRIERATRNTPIVLLRGRSGAALSMLDMFEDWSLEKWAATDSPVTLLRLQPRAVLIDVTHVSYDLFSARLHLEQLELDLEQPFMVAPISGNVWRRCVREYLLTCTCTTQCTSCQFQS